VAKPEIVPVGAQLGEGPFWSAAKKPSGSSTSRASSSTASRAERQDAVVAGPFRAGISSSPQKTATFIAGCKTGLHRFNPKTGEFKLLEAPEPKARKHA